MTVRSAVRRGARRAWDHGRVDGTQEGTREARPRRGRPGHDQETVLRRAVELFNRQGYDATSIGDIARELGLTKSALYHHFVRRDDTLRRMT